MYALYLGKKAVCYMRQSILGEGKEEQAKQIVDTLLKKLQCNQVQVADLHEERDKLIVEAGVTPPAK